MRKRLFILTLLSTAALSFASPISTPNNVNDTPIVSNGGGTVGGGQCQAYTTDGSLVNLSGVSRVTFYASGNCSLLGADPSLYVDWWGTKVCTSGGYLSTQITQASGTAFIKARGIYGGIYGGRSLSRTAIGLFTDNSGSQSSFIAGAGGGGNSGDGGGWYGEGFYGWHDYWIPGGSVYGGCSWFSVYGGSGAGIGFYGGCPGISDDPASFAWYHGSGGASSISAFYNIPTKTYTSLGSSFTLTGGGYIVSTNAVAYVCK